MFYTIDSAYHGPYPARIEAAINHTVAQIYGNNPEHIVVIATRFTTEFGVDFNIRWPRVNTWLQRDNSGDIQILFSFRDDQEQLVELETWLLAPDEIQIAWLSYPLEKEL